MPTIAEIHNRQKRLLAAMDQERQSWFPHWRDISDFFLPRRYPWLSTQAEVRTADRTNKKLLDSTSTIAVRTLASGMMSGITSPARPWFRLRLAGFPEAAMTQPARVWLEEVQRRMMVQMAESNLYNALAVLYLEWCTFGTACLLIYEDFRDVFRCYNSPLGEFYLSMDEAGRVNRIGRRFQLTLEQCVLRFGLGALKPSDQAHYSAGGANKLKTIEIHHLLEYNDDPFPDIAKAAPYRELYWQADAEDGRYLLAAPVYEWLGITPRWELIGNDSYGVSPAMDCLADVKELQQLHLERAQALAKQVRPPLIVDQQLRNRPKALGAGGLTYAATSNQNFGAKPAYSVQLPYAEILQSIQAKQTHIREVCKNDLFSMISQLDTVRSATEIDARREEKLIHLGPVFERFSNEGLDPLLKRIYGIMDRAGLFPEAPPELGDMEIEVEYVSIMSDAQRASSTISIERFLATAGQAAGVWPEARNIPDVNELMRAYAEGIGVPPKGLRSREDVAEAAQAEQAQAELAATAQVGSQFAQGAKVLSEADVGGGMNALQAMMG